MKIINNTDWQTRDLRKLLLECFKRAGMEHKSRIKYRYSSGGHHLIIINTGGYSGCAPLGGKRITVRVPTAEGNTFDPMSFAHTVMHELAHNRGINHVDMIPELRSWDRGWRDYVAWADGFTVKQVVAISKPNPVEVRKARALRNVRKYQTKLKRTQTILRRWQKKVKYYQKKEIDNYGS